MVLLDQTINVYLTLQNTSKLFCKVVVQFYIHTSDMDQLIHPQPCNINFAHHLNLAITVGLYLVVVLISIITNYIEHSLICLLVSCISFMQCFCKHFAHLYLGFLIETE